MQPTAKQEDRPSYVTFQRLPVEDREATLTKGHYSTKDLDFALVTPVGSKDRIPREISVWLKELEAQVREERLDPRVADAYRAAYEKWKRGEEIPLHGTPIKGWPLIASSLQQTIIAANVLTVEDLAQANGEACERIGIGAIQLKEKAQRWLDSAKDVGRVALENERLKTENETMRHEIDLLTKQVKELAAKLEAD